MNTPSINKYDSALRAVLMEGEEIGAQNMRILSSESINSSPIPQQRRSTFHRKTLFPPSQMFLPLPADQLV